MAIRIQKLQVQNLGPIKALQESLVLVNLIYGQNESGKTYLVEFLLQSVFRQSKNWSLRKNFGKGIVQIQGIGPDPIQFSPEGNRKIEHYWTEAGNGLPNNMARLLVVRGGELDLAAKSPGGVDRSSLRTALTSQELLDQIWDAIPATVQSATLEGGQILGKNMGMIKAQNDLQKEIQSLNELLDQIENQYSRGPLRELERDLEIAQDRFHNQLMAKQHLAYIAWQRLAELNRQRELLSKGDLQLLRDLIREIETLDRDITALKSKYNKENKQSQDYPWLETALEVWERKDLENKKVPQSLIGVSGLISIGIGTVLMIIENLASAPELIWIGGILSGIGLGLSIYYGIRIINWSGQVEESSERKSIRDDYEKKFKEPLRGFTDLKSKKSLLQRTYISAQTTQSLLKEKQNQRKLKKQVIENQFSSFSYQPESEVSWREDLEELEKKSEILDSNLLETKLHLSKLNIHENDYVEKSPGIDFDPVIMQELVGEIERIENSLADLQADLDNLKARACERTGDDIRDPWQDILYNLQSIQEDRTREHKDLTADLIAKIGLTEVLTRLREDEDRKINQAINTETVSSILHNITGRYQRLDLEDDQVFVHDSFSKYALSDLSTGAREQVQLALRLGIASQICEGNPLFLILDDAFQHSDWNRREALLQSTLELARSGWQIIYLTMDDHIRDLFLTKVKPALKNDFKLIELV